MATNASKNLIQLPSDRSKGDGSRRDIGRDAHSPLIRKLVICEQRQRSIEILHSCACSGFNSAINLDYSDQNDKSKGFIDKAQNASMIIAQLMTPQILRSFSCTPINWISCGFEHCLALTVFGTVASWGYGASGCLGHGNYISYMQPKLIAFGFRDSLIRYIECGGYHNAAITDDGQLFTWGRSDVGQVGQPESKL